MLFVIALSLVLAGCASAPFETEGIDLGTLPAEVREEPDATRGRLVLWGGTIARAHNLEEQTLLEVVAFPLADRTQRPRLGAATLGRFRVYIDGYLETARFSAGREVTVRGRVGGPETGQVGEAEYVFPVIRSGELELWPERSRYDEGGSRVRFNFGLIFSN